MARKLVGLPGWPRGLNAREAAAYVGFSPTAMRGEGRAGRFPNPVRLSPRRLVYLREDLDRYLDKLAGHAAPADGTAPDPFLALLGGSP